MPITHQIVNQDPNGSSAPPLPGGDVLSQLSGLIGQAQGLVGGSGGIGGGTGVGLPGLQSIGSTIAGLTSSITAAGGTTAIAGAITSLGTQMSTGLMSGMSGLLSGLTSQLSSLTSLLNPAGLLSQALHIHLLDKAQGILHSAFQGQHTVKLGSGGIDITSAIKVAHTAPMLPHNGLTLISDALQVTKGIFGQSFSMLSDRRLKRKIKDHPRVLDKVMALKLKTFDMQSMDWEKEEALPGYRPSFGLIAQEVQEVFPEVVKDGKFLTIEESKIGLLLLAAFQEFVTETRQQLAEMKKS